MSNNYAGKFVSAETAVKAVQPGDWVDYGFGAGFPELLDRALAARRDELTDVKIRGGLVIRPRIEVVESDPEQKAFSYYSWHIGDYAFPAGNVPPPHSRGCCLCTGFQTRCERLLRTGYFQLCMAHHL